MHPAFSQTDHRPWPLPRGPWVMRQNWEQLAFLHYPIAPDVLRPLLPPHLELQLFDGTAWIGIVPFVMTDVAPRAIPALHPWHRFPEINVRTYVTHRGKPGVWFLSLDVPHRFTVWTARTFFHLPYFRAAMDVRREPAGAGIRYQTTRGTLNFSAVYSGGEPAPAQPGSFEHWATERYCLYSADARGRLYCGEVQHPRWPLQKLHLDLETSRMTDLSLGPLHPSILYSEKLSVAIYAPQRVA